VGRAAALLRGAKGKRLLYRQLISKPKKPGPPRCSVALTQHLVSVLPIPP
jgi:hypothetical protein